MINWKGKDNNWGNNVILLKKKLHFNQEEGITILIKRRTVQNNSVLENKLEVLPEGPEINDPKRKLLPCVTKDDVSLICKSLKFKLKAMKVPYNKIENV